ncbi:MAG: 3-dehydroquinate synthase II [Candidatus Methanomethylophilaceae archaeon]|nr:3-dehydroquinate synthase II [Candidatus Methanomethylophilaceae archaeon]
MKGIIVKADGPKDRDARKDLVTNALEAGICRFIIRDGDNEFESLGKMEAIYFEKGVSKDGKYEILDIDDPKSQSHAMSMAGKRDAVIVRTSDWTVIPLENMISKFAPSGTKVYAVATNLEEARLFLTTMEKGVDGIVIDVTDPLSISKFKDIITESPSEQLSEVTIKDIKPVEMGDRVCIDTCSMMSPGEGMLIGSYSNCLFLIQSESEDNGYVASRPFRVNAGAVHSYMEVPGGGTRYLSEIQGGDSVLLCDSKGNTRVASVGRCKVEKRPLLMVTATDGKKEYSVMLQNAETIKMVSKEGSVSVTRLSPGDKVLAKIEKGGRHFGMAIEETITEK